MLFLKTLRGQLTILFIFFTTIVSLATIFLLLFMTKSLIQKQVDHHLHIVVNEAKQIIEDTYDIKKEDILKNLVSAQGMTVVLLSADGSPILQTNSNDVASISEHEMQQIVFSSSNNLEPKHFSIELIQFATVPVNIPEYGKGTLAVGFSTDVLNNTMQSITTTAIIVLLITLLILSLFWQKLVKHYLLPLEKISHQALKIKTSSDLTHNIKTKSTSSELKNITTAFNTLLKKLKIVFDKEHDFFSDTAHSLKTPLAVIRSYIESLPRQSKKQKGEVLKNIDNLNITIQDLLLISKLHSDYKNTSKKISLSKITKQISELTSVLATEKNITVINNINENIFIKADRRLLKRAIANVAKNSVDHEKINGTITFNLTKNKNQIKLTITDTGIGISKKDLPHIFDRFYQGKNSLSKKGNGLGLAISKVVVEKINGTLSIKSKINKGSQVIFIFY